MTEPAIIHAFKKTGESIASLTINVDVFCSKEIIDHVEFGFKNYCSLTFRIPVDFIDIEFESNSGFMQYIFELNDLLDTSIDPFNLD